MVHDWGIPFWGDGECYYWTKAVIIFGFFWYLRFYSSAKVRLYYPKVIVLRGIPKLVKRETRVTNQIF